MSVNPERAPLRVFVSSTSEDLKSYRASAKLAVEDADWDPRMMEQFGAMLEPTVRACLDEIARCDVVVLIVGFRRGWVPKPDEGGDGVASITQIELNHARALRKPVLAFMAREDEWPGKLYEEADEGRSWVRAFRGALNQPAAMFDYERASSDLSLPVFRSVVLNELNRFKASLPAPAGTQAEPRLGTIAIALRTGTRIPLVGPGVFGDGPLGLPAISDGLSRAFGNLSKTESLATLAEHCERHAGSRDDLLNTVRVLLEAQTQNVSAGPVHDLLTSLGEVPLIVSASFDRVIERALQARGVEFAVVSHVLRSFDDEYDGKVLVEHSDGRIELHPAPDLDLRGVGRVIYKPLGSPLLLGPSAEDLGLDTAVLTETDHFRLFRLLQSQQTGVPPAIVKWLKRWELLYIGYGLDVWQFRLVTQILGAIGRRARGASSTPFAVRRSRDELETLSWRELGARVIEMDPDQFALGVLAQIASGELHA